MRILLNAADTALDNADESIENEWKRTLEGYCVIPSSGLDYCFGLVNMILRRRLVKAYDLATSFIEAHVNAEKDISRILGKESVVATIQQESRASVRRARRFVRDVEHSFEGLCEGYKTMLLVQRVLRETQLHLKDMFSRAELGEEDYEICQTRILKSIDKVRKHGGGVIPVVDDEALFASSHIFEGVSSDIVAQLRKHASKRIYSHGETIVHRGDTYPGIIIIIRGTVRMTMLTEHLAESEENDIRPFAPPGKPSAQTTRGITISLPGPVVRKGAHESERRQSLVERQHP